MQRAGREAIAQAVPAKPAMRRTPPRRSHLPDEHIPHDDVVVGRRSIQDYYEERKIAPAVPMRARVPAPSKAPKLVVEEEKFANPHERLISYNAKIAEAKKKAEEKADAEVQNKTLEEVELEKLKAKQDRLRRDRQLREEQRIKMRALRIAQMKEGQ